MADFTIKQGDTKPEIRATLKDANGTAINLTGATVRFHLSAKVSGTVKVDSPATVISASEGIVQYAWSTGDTDTAGVYNAEWEITFSDGSVQTVPNDGYDEVLIKAQLA